jgi:hypothetical protein
MCSSIGKPEREKKNINGELSSLGVLLREECHHVKISGMVWLHFSPYLPSLEVGGGGDLFVTVKKATFF